jgi:hypothetical protein
MAKKLVGTDFVGLEHAKKADEALRKAAQLLDGLPTGLHRPMDAFHRPSADDPAPGLWASGLRELLEEDWPARLYELGDAVSDAHTLIDSLRVEMYGLSSGLTGLWEHWHPRRLPPSLNKNVVELLNEVDRAREHCSEWDWNAPPVVRDGSDRGRFSRDAVARTIAHYVHRLSRELDEYLDELFRLFVLVNQTGERNAAIRQHLREQAKASTSTNGTTVGIGKTTNPAISSAPRASGTGKLVIDGERLQAQAWRQCKLLLKDSVFATLKEGGARRTVNLSRTVRNALELLQAHGETDFDAPTTKRARSIASEIRKHLRSIFEVPDGDPVPNIGKGRYTTEIILSIPK